MFIYRIMNLREVKAHGSMVDKWRSCLDREKMHG